MTTEKIYWKSLFDEIAAKIAFYLIKYIYETDTTLQVHCKECGNIIENSTTPIIIMSSNFLDEEFTKFNGVTVAVICVTCIATSERNYTIKQIDDIRFDK